MEPKLHDQQQQQQRVHGVVVITLPPSDDPSQGKTISAFTLTDHDYPLEIPPEEDLNPSFQPDPLHQNPQFQLWFSDLSMSSPRLVLSLLGISLIVIALYGSVFSNSVTMFRVSDERNRDDDNSDRETTSFVFPVFHKLRAREFHDRILAEDLGVENGIFVEAMDLELVNPVKVNSVLSTTAGSVDSSSSTTMFPVGGNVYPDGLYYTRILVGKPEDGHYYHLDIDTGSDLTWIQCDAPCTSCAKGANQLYKPKNDNLVRSSEPLCVEVQRNQMTEHFESLQQCDYEIEYADHSYSMGVLTKDKFHLKLHNGSLAESDIVFGCGYDQQGLLLNTLLKTDGILGLSRAKISLPSQLASRGIISNVVGHCLASDLNGEGYIFMGSDLVPSHGITWVPMLHHSRLEVYQMQVTKMSYGNAMLSLDGENGRVGKALFDTGSSYTYFPNQAYTQLVASLQEVSGLELIHDDSDKTLPICWRAKTNFPISSLSDVKKFFRPITLQIGSKWLIISRRLLIQPEDYLIISDKGNICLGILDGSSVHDGSTIILGDISMRGHLIVYDNLKQRIGWMKSDCVRPREFDHIL
ncbi:PREDICTED: aspartyl protease APCB1 [Camelina sativa]|uniref:Aspartyl protease APCB1 n=1 Tax=Camelina sativa TaxID=90675 RepID=A0ABM0YG95_CAMSA|nr:PREDICTED: aspartyl protease APCB1 [Camelina sativa]XP_010500448.1 PREDICTED: aspartyl protease APCB1 [Camelina sativa]